jgi:hypothetical protein
VKAVRLLFGLLLLASVAFLLLGELSIGFGLWFAPGWANGWPGGLSIYFVWPAGMTLILFAILMTIGFGVVGSTCIALSASSGSPSTKRDFEGSFAIWMVIWLTVVSVICACAYFVFYLSALDMWPNGYPAGNL